MWGKFCAFELVTDHENGQHNKYNCFGTMELMHTNCFVYTSTWFEKMFLSCKVNKSVHHENKFNDVHFVTIGLLNNLPQSIIQWSPMALRSKHL